MTKLEKQGHVKQAIDLLNLGECIIIGEYRGIRVDEREFADKQNPAVKVLRVIVTHSFESALGEQMPCIEYMPPGTKKADVKGTYQQGEKVICTVSALAYRGGIRKITVKSFQLLSGLLT